MNILKLIQHHLKSQGITTTYDKDIDILTHKHKPTSIHLDIQTTTQNPNHIIITPWNNRKGIITSKNHQPIELQLADPQLFPKLLNYIKNYQP